MQVDQVVQLRLDGGVDMKLVGARRVQLPVDKVVEVLDVFEQVGP
jgi:hypothetical protein